MTLQEQIAALPEWPERVDNFDITVKNWGRWQQARAEAALARLALAREWMGRASHRADCAFWDGHPQREPQGIRHWIDGPCTCGRDVLLKALKP